jgi:quinol monooxygenase YgiN
MQPSPAIRFVITIQVHDIERFTSLVARCVEISRTEPGTLHYDWFLHEATGEARLVEAYASVEAVRAHTRGPVFTDVGPELLRTCTFVGMDAFGDTGSLGDGPQGWASTYWGAPFAELTE